VNDLAAVAAADEDGDLGPPEGAERTSLDLALVELGVDHPDAAWRDDDVVDARPRSWDATVMERERGVR
jgi:hypothetical protein